MAEATRRGIRSAQFGVLINALLAATKILAGVAGNSYALIADGIESGTDIFSSMIVVSGLRIAERDPSEAFPFGYGKAETLATVAVALMLLAAAIGIAIEAVREILTPHHLPASWTLLVLLAVIIIKWLVSRQVNAIGTEIGSSAVRADAWHHLSDAITSVAAFIGISIALWGGPGWEPADDWAALVGSLVIGFNGFSILWSALRELMDAAPAGDVLAEIRRVSEAVPGVLAIEKLFVRKSGLIYHVAIHVQAAGDMPLAEAHSLGGKVKGAILQTISTIGTVFVHMEPFEDRPTES